MRIVVSGTHASGKSTLISDFALRHPEYEVLSDPFDLIDEAMDAPGAAMFAAQLGASASRLLEEPQANLIAERGPLDFLAYLLAGSGDDLSSDFIERMTALAARALDTVDLLVVLPLSPADAIFIDADEDPQLRAAMNDVLLDLICDSDAVGSMLTVAEVTGSPATRLALLEQLAGLR